MKGRCLVVANQTLGGEALDRAIVDGVQGGIRDFYVVVPVTPVEFETSGWTGGFHLDEAEMYLPEQVEAAAIEGARRDRLAHAKARRRAERRLVLMLLKVASHGGEADGAVIENDPLEATRSVLAEQAGFEQIIISTLPSGLSRWLRMDLPNRVARITDVPVITVEADDEMGDISSPPPTLQG